MWYTNRQSLRTYLYGNILAWLLLLTANITFYMLFTLSGGQLFNTDIAFSGVFINIFLIACFFLFDYKAEKYLEHTALLHLQRQTRYILLAMLLAAIIQASMIVLQRPLILNANRFIYISYLLHLLLFAVLLHVMLFTYRNLILKKSPRRTYRLWAAFIYILLASLIFNYFRLRIDTLPAELVVGILMGLGVLLSFNLRWVAYLNVQEKGHAIGLLGLSVLGYGYFLVYFFHYWHYPFPELNLFYNPYLLTIAGFVFWYSLLSVLVLLFNIPVSRVFESKLKDILAFQELTQSLQLLDSERTLFEMLMEQSKKTAMADAAFVEVLALDGLDHQLLLRDITQQEARQIRAQINRERLLQALIDALPVHESPQQQENKVSFLTYQRFAVSSRTQKVGELVLLRRSDEPFQQEQIEVVGAFATQVGIAIENRRLIKEIIARERYKQELDIAKRIQQSLLPQQLQLPSNLQLAAISLPAREVGGDYYDVFLIDEHRFYLAVGDVSGKGTGAAFHMAELKGIFQALAPLGFHPKQLAMHINQAVKACMPRKTFVTLSLFYIETTTQLIEMVRGGHCPAIFYKSSAKSCFRLDQKSIGLGIVDNPHFEQLTESYRIPYEKADVLVLYSDGLLEARNAAGEEFGEQRLVQLVASYADKSAESILRYITEAVQHFTMPEQAQQDDYTLLVLKFGA